MTNSDLIDKLNQMLGAVEHMQGQVTEQGKRLNEIGERMVVVEGGVLETKGIVEAWNAAKLSLRFAKWLTAFVAALAAAFATFKGWMHR